MALLGGAGAAHAEDGVPAGDGETPTGALCDAEAIEAGLVDENCEPVEPEAPPAPEGEEAAPPAEESQADPQQEPAEPEPAPAEEDGSTDAEPGAGAWEKPDGPQEVKPGPKDDKDKGDGKGDDKGKGKGKGGKKDKDEDKGKGKGGNGAGPGHGGPGNPGGGGKGEDTPGNDGPGKGPGNNGPGNDGPGNDDDSSGGSGGKNGKKDEDGKPGDRDGGPRNENDGRGARNGNGSSQDGEAGAQDHGGDEAGPSPYPGAPYGGAPIVHGSTSGVGATEIPAFLIPIFKQCGQRYGVPWNVLAAINKVETDFGSNLNISSAGAMGWMQFMPPTWDAYGVDANGDGKRDPYNPRDAICSAANYLDASGASENMSRAVFAYNHADWYVEMVLSLAREYSQLDLSDPLPRTKRLDPEFAKELTRTAREHKVDWALMLAVVRASGARGPSPAEPKELEEIAKLIARDRGDAETAAANFVGDDPALAEDVVVLSRYHRAIGIRGLTDGLYAVSDDMARRALDSKVLEIYEGGRTDIADGQIDAQTLALLLYLAESHDQIVITSLISGHGFYSRPGVPSAHVYGRAVDIAMVDGVNALGGQQPGSVIEETVREILSLPPELMPAQVISLYEFGGPSFYAADHDDHIHVGF